MRTTIIDAKSKLIHKCFDSLNSITIGYNRSTFGGVNGRLSWDPVIIETVYANFVPMSNTYKIKIEDALSCEMEGCFIKYDTFARVNDPTCYLTYVFQPDSVKLLHEVISSSTPFDPIAAYERAMSIIGRF